METGTLGQVERTIFFRMGRANQRRRERGAVMDVMGFGNRRSGGKSVFFVIGVLIMVAAIISLVVLNTF